MTIDLDGSSEQMEGPVNCGFAQTVSACRVAFKLLINPERPVDGGTFKTLEVKAPPGSIFDRAGAGRVPVVLQLARPADRPGRDGARARPARTRWRPRTSATRWSPFLSGRDPRRGGAPFLYVMPHAGGWGAFEGGDGEDGLINNVNGGFKDYPVEVFETKYPAVIRGYGFRPDTGGPGRFRGGCGIYRLHEVEPESRLYLWFERSVTPGWGLFGGRDAVGPDVVVDPTAPDERHLLKVNALPARCRNESWELKTGGGGGFGERVRARPGAGAPGRARRVRDPRGAERDYGVVLSDDLSIDEDATNRLRTFLLMATRVAVDIGGTFTDLVHLEAESGEVGAAKASTTPRRFEDGVLEALGQADLRRRRLPRPRNDGDHQRADRAEGRADRADHDARASATCSRSRRRTGPTSTTCSTASRSRSSGGACASR